MGQKISPHGLRLGVTKKWDSLWYAEGSDYSDNLIDDIKIRKLIRKKVSDAGVGRAIIRRSENKIDVSIFVAKPGVAIGRGGSGIDELKEAIEKLTGLNTSVRINEVKRADLSARIVARSIADGIERRVPSKVMMSSFKEKVLQAGATGLKINISGRIGGAKQARTIKVSEGRVPLHTLRADIDYAEERARVPNLCTFGVKVWIYDERDDEDNEDN
ncbi:30S ribosomal protein S3 [Candidatus Dojkabacteria bacterium]|nr:30S ribosomal protein S3 [Candidatus Dojkabacteria bacterium]